MSHIFRVCVVKGGCAGVELLCRVRFKSHQLKLNWSCSWAVTITYSFFIGLGPKMTQIKNLFRVLSENLKICFFHKAKLCKNPIENSVFSCNLFFSLGKKNVDGVPKTQLKKNPPKLNL